MEHLSRRLKKSEKAFTLIELLVVIAIIAILAAILFPVFAQAKAAAKTAVTVSNVKQEMLALQMYINDYDDVAFLPYGLGTYPVELTYPYTKNVFITWDASSSIPNFADPMVGNIPGGYSPQYWGDWTLTGTLSWSQNGLQYQGGPRNYSAQEHPAETAVMVPFSNPDGEYFNGPASNYASGDLGWFTFDPTNLSCYADYTGAGWVNVAQNGITRAANLWHHNGYVTGFEDGHAKSMQGETFDDTQGGANGCGAQTYNYWVDDALDAPVYGADPYMDQPVNPWSAWYLQPSHFKYWGTWWDADQ